MAEGDTRIDHNGSNGLACQPKLSTPAVCGPPSRLRRYGGQPSRESRAKVGGERGIRAESRGAAAPRAVALEARSLRQKERSEFGGERGIRTLGRVSPTHAFQACSFNHSDISPFRINNLRAALNKLSHTPSAIAALTRSHSFLVTCSEGRQGTSGGLCKIS